MHTRVRMYMGALAGVAALALGGTAAALATQSGSEGHAGLNDPAGGANVQQEVQEGAQSGAQDNAGLNDPAGGAQDNAGSDVASASAQPRAGDGAEPLSAETDGPGGHQDAPGNIEDQSGR